MPTAIPKERAPNLNRAQRKRLYHQKLAAKPPRPDMEVERDGYEVFLDPCYYDMFCVRPKGSRSFENTVHVGTKEEAERVIDWLVGRSEDLPLLEPRDRSVLTLWKKIPGVAIASEKNHAVLDL